MVARAGCPVPRQSSMLAGARPGDRGGRELLQDTARAFVNGPCRQRMNGGTVSASTGARPPRIGLRAHLLSRRPSAESGLGRLVRSRAGNSRLPGGATNRPVDEGALRKPNGTKFHLRTPGCTSDCKRSSRELPGIGVPRGSRTPVAAVKGRCPRPLDDGDGFLNAGRAGLPSGRPLSWCGGARRDRTADLYNAIVALSQLSYGPGEGANSPTGSLACQGAGAGPEGVGGRGVDRRGAGSRRPQGSRRRRFRPPPEPG